MKLKAGKDVIELVRLSYKANKPVLLEGKHGVGKSELLIQASERLGVDVIVQDLSLLEPCDIIGLPVLENGRSRYAYPSWLPESGKGLLVFEELARSSREVLAPVLNILTTRRVGDFRLGSGWLPCAATNVQDEGYDVNTLCPALLSRFCRITIEADVKGWLAWAETHEVHPAVCRFVRNTPSIFEAAESNPRAWTYVSDIVKAFEADGGREEGLLAVAVAGLVGEPLGVAFTQQYLNGEEPLSAAQIFDEYDHHRNTVRRWARDKRVDLLNSSAHNVMVALQDADTASRVEASMMCKGNLDELSTRLPADLRKIFFSRLKDSGVKI